METPERIREVLAEWRDTERRVEELRRLLCRRLRGFIEGDGRDAQSSQGRGRPFGGVGVPRVRIISATREAARSFKASLRGLSGFRSIRALPPFSVVRLGDLLIAFAMFRLSIYGFSSGG